MDGMGAAAGAPPPHNHSAHAPHGGHDKMGGIVRLPDGSYFYPHGGYSGHVLPGGMFLAWGFWWALCTCIAYVRCLAAGRPFRTRGWQAVPAGPPALRALPLEPLVKLTLPLVGILGELWFGHESWRTLYADSGHYVTDNLNDWQHAAMYASFCLSGLVDLLCHYAGAPGGTDLAFLGLAFLSEGVLLGFHLKGPEVEVRVHLILVLQVLATVAAILAELARPSSILAALARPWLTLLQGAWWIQTAFIMYVKAPQWDPDDMGAGMMVPVPFVLWTLSSAFFVLGLFLAVKAAAQWRLGRRLDCGAAGGGSGVVVGGLMLPGHAHTQLASDDEVAVEAVGGDLELSGLLKPYHHGHQR